ncbi:thioredoxin-like protein [Kockovaella imperatae]|uniref:Protein disulfide-isomerase n=1 Tax=Kockovaella imperatae TaxID=4999 RepID=A0A1Y1UK05_9TREE|nr:thioredoxin-like protein [Kockovaella imperatae]ORX37455.1 thioredoxin-like protein [Kockovaella imperatae]
MRYSTLLSLLATFTAGALASDVIDLTGGTFKSEVNGEDLALVEFFAPWCGHCKNLAPHYEEAATELKSKLGVKLAKVDCTEEAELCKEFGVNGYPTLKVFRNGVPTDYAGPRKADGIISYMVKQSLPAVSEVTPSSHDEFIKQDKVVLVAYGDESHPVPAAFAEYANSARDTYLFGQYLDSSLPSIPESPSLPAIVLYKQFDEGHNVLSTSEVSSLTADSLAEFIKSNSMPLVDEISPENFGDYAERGLPIAYVFAEPDDTATREQFIEEIKPIVKEFKDKVSFVTIDAVRFVDHGKGLALPGEDWPAFVIQELAEQSKYPLDTKFSAKNVEAHLRAYVDGKLSPKIKSEPIPKTQDQPVYHLTADGWDALFGDDSKDVFAEFFAPWCGHCKKLAPVWEELGEKYQNSKNVVIAQMDATLNDIPPTAPFKVAGFPTLKFRPAGSSDFEDYMGGRTLEDLIEFVEANKKSEGPLSTEEAVEERSDEDSAVAGEEEEVVEHDEL